MVCCAKQNKKKREREREKRRRGYVELANKKVWLPIVNSIWSEKTEIFPGMATKTFYDDCMDSQPVN